MLTTAIKFCGMTRPEDVHLAAELGATHVGAIFAPSPRRITAHDAAQVWLDVPSVKKVGVFADASVKKILRTADVAGIDVIQLHTDTGADAVKELRASFAGEIWSVLRIAEGGILNSMTDVSLADAVLVDSYSESGLGGTGRAFDWVGESGGIRRVVGDRRLIVAGGLDPDNVADAITALQPHLVDVSSGVESAPGVKDPDRMRAFVLAVGRADAA